jgi:hypothetical protein
MYPYASQRTDTFAPDRLCVGSSIRPRHSKQTLLSGQNTVRGAVLGIVAGAITSAAAAGNTGNGAMGAVTPGAGVRPGVYRVTIIEPATNGGVFVVEAPNGVTVGRGSVAVAFAGPINFTLADGATDFVSGDTFTITVAAGTKYKLAAAAATDGSDDPVAILIEDCDATAADTECLVYEGGEFNANALTLGAGHSIASVTAALKSRGIHLITPLDV